MQIKAKLGSIVHAELTVFFQKGSQMIFHQNKKIYKKIF